MQLRLADIAGRADTCDDLAARHLLPALDQHLIAMGVGRDPPIGMFDENQITVTAQLVSAIGYYSGLGNLHRYSLRGGNVYPIVVSAVTPQAIGCDEVTPNRPKKSAVAANCRGCRRRFRTRGWWK